jgi:hypothetical protein
LKATRKVLTNTKKISADLEFVTWVKRKKSGSGEGGRARNISKRAYAHVEFLQPCESQVPCSQKSCVDKTRDVRVTGQLC